MTPQVEVELKKQIPKDEQKEMISVHRTESGRYSARINYSSLDVLQTCMRKSDFLLNQKFQTSTQSPALVFGSGIHKAMEVWYCSPKDHRRHGSVACDDSQALMLSGQDPLMHGNCARCSSVFAFLETAKDKLTENDFQRSPENGINILNHYFDTYKDDPYELVIDELGPLCERSFEFPFHLDRNLSISFFGTIDSILRDRVTGEIVICDHKTTSSLGKDFMNRLKPNFQYTGYWWAAEEVFKLKPSCFMVNGIQVAKTRQEVMRQFTSITAEEIQELRLALVYSVQRYIQGLETGIWPMAKSTMCCEWGGCMYKKVCELPGNIQKSMLASEFTQGATNG